MDFDELIKQLKKLNPNATIRTANPILYSKATSEIFCSVPMDKLVLPEGFYCNEKNGITNKHNVCAYLSVHVQPLKGVNEALLMPKKTKVTNNIVEKEFPKTYIKETITLINPIVDPKYDFTFMGMKKTFDGYSLVRDNNGNLMAKNNLNGTTYCDTLMVQRIKMALIWVRSIQCTHPRKSPLTNEITSDDYDYAFNEGAKDTYNTIMNSIQKQLVETGNINPIEVVNSVEKMVPQYKYANSIAEHLFSQKGYVNTIYNWVNFATPNALKPTKPLLTIDQARAYEIQKKLTR